MAEILLTGDRVMLVDDADLAMLSGFSLHFSAGKYARADRGGLMIYVHRLIAGAAPGEEVDHINGNGLDNRTANLRRTDRKGNAANRGADNRRLGTSSRHKGVCFDKSRQKWAAYIHIDGKTRALGRFSTEDEAAVSYNSAALTAWGEMARLNIIGGDAP